MKKSMYIALLIFSSLWGNSIANAETKVEKSTWTRYGTSFLADGLGIGVDRFGNSYVVGFNSSFKDEQNAYGYNPYYIAKYDPAGEQIWFVRVGASKNEEEHGFTYGYGISVDEDGTSYITGKTDIGLSEQKQISAVDYFVAKYDKDGHLQWSRQNGVELDSSQLEAGWLSLSKANSIGVDAEGNSYVTGQHNLASSINDVGNLNTCFIAKYSSDGNFGWETKLDAKYACVNTLGISADSEGNSYVTGLVHESETLEEQSINYFVAKYDTEGKLAWFKKAPNAEGNKKDRDHYGYITVFSTGIGIDIDGNSYVSGYTNAGITSDASQIGFFDGFVAKYDQSGNLEWTKQIGTPNRETRAWGISVDKEGHSYIVGSYDKNLDPKLDLKEGYFIAKYAPDGKQISIYQDDSSSEGKVGRAIAADSRGMTYVTGLFELVTAGDRGRNIQSYFITKSEK